MKAIQITKHGGSEAMEYKDVPTPDPGADEVLLKLGACWSKFHRCIPTNRFIPC